jgi:hypothetical protein
MSGTSAVDHCTGLHVGGFVGNAGDRVSITREQTCVSLYMSFALAHSPLVSHRLYQSGRSTIPFVSTNLHLAFNRPLPRPLPHSDRASLICARSVDGSPFVCNDRLCSGHPNEGLPVWSASCLHARHLTLRRLYYCAVLYPI